MKNNYLVQAWLVLLLALCFGAALAGVQVSLSGRIEENKLAETKGQIPYLVPDSADSRKVEIGDDVVYRAFNGLGETVGWVLTVTGQGFADKIEMLIGLNEDASVITGLYILDQKETPGLGDKIRGEWKDQFKDVKGTEPLRVVKASATEATEIEAVTGATISSDAVVTTVNKEVAAFNALLREM